MSSVRTLDADALAQLERSNEPALIKVDLADCAACAALQPFWQAAAEHYRGITWHASCSTLPAFCQSQDIGCAVTSTGAPPVCEPAFLTWSGGQFARYSGGKQVQQLSAWLQQAISQPSVRPQAVGRPDDPPAASAGVNTLNASALARLERSNEPALIKVDLPGCADCAALQPFWKLASERFRGLTWHASCSAFPAFCQSQGIGCDASKGQYAFARPSVCEPVFLARSRGQFVRFSGGKSVAPLLLWLQQHSVEQPSAAPLPRTEPHVKLVRSLGSKAALRALTASRSVAYVRYDPEGCSSACAELDGPWEHVATDFHVPGGVWRVACEAQPALCAARVGDALAARQPIIEAWNGTHFERYVGQLNPPIAVIMELMRLPEYVAAGQGVLGDGEQCAAWAESGGCESKRGDRSRGEMHAKCAHACGEHPEPRGWAETGWVDEDEGAAECVPTAAPGSRRWWATVQTRAEALGGLRLDADGLAYRLPAFASESEVRRLVALGRSITKIDDQTPYTDASREPLLAALLQRVAELTGVLRHNHSGSDFVLRAIWPVRALCMLCACVT